MVLCENKFWCKSLNDLFCDWRLIPSRKMTLDSQINCLLRLLFILFIICLIFNINNTIFFLIFIIIIIIILYMIKESKMIQQTENFAYTYPEEGQNYPSNKTRLWNTAYERAPTDQNGDVIENVLNSGRFAYDNVEIDPNNMEYVSNNYKIVGKPNPKTLVPPVIAPPIADLSYWKANNLVTHTAINDNKNIDVYQSGYEVSNFCGNNEMPKENNNFDYIKLNSNYRKMKQGEEPEFNQRHNSRYHQKYNEHQMKTHTQISGEPHYNTEYNEIRENFTKEKKEKRKVKVEDVGYVNKSCGYDQKQFDKYGLPVNINTGKCYKNAGMKNYNKNLYTQIIQPGVYSIDQVNEPINSNIGISFEQQFDPLTYDVIDDGILYTQHDPNDPDFDEKDNILKYNDNEVIQPITTYNVYDPRYSGYGTSYRAYTDNNVGNTKFFYDDIDSVRMPNYVTRSKIDAFNFADTYGPMENERGNVNNSTIRALANQKFLDDALEFRTGMQERLMRKTNAEAWQQRKFPINKNSQRMLGGFSMR